MLLLGPGSLCSSVSLLLVLLIMKVHFAQMLKFITCYLSDALKIHRTVRKQAVAGCKDPAEV